MPGNTLPAGVGTPASVIVTANVDGVAMIHTDFISTADEGIETHVPKLAVTT